MGKHNFGAAQRLVDHAVKRRDFPAAVLWVCDEGQPIYARASGQAVLDSVFDVASLTKPFATTAVAMRLVASDALTLRTRVGDVLKDCGAVGKSTFGSLLSHSSGLPAWRPFFERTRLMSPQTARRTTRREARCAELEYAPGKRAIYSDLGFIVAQQVVEAVAGKPLDRLAAELLYRPLRLSRTVFLPTRRDRAAPSWDIVPTERCPFRGRLRGQVHDDNCHAIGGVGGHAGLFSTAHDLHELTRELVSAWHGGRSIFERDVVRSFWRYRVANSSWAAGFDRPSTRGRQPSSSGRAFSPTAIGHLGFTGTSIWIEPRQSRWVILLTNRVYRGREPNPMKTFRPKLHDAIGRGAWGLAPKPNLR